MLRQELRQSVKEGPRQEDNRRDTNCFIIYGTLLTFSLINNLSCLIVFFNPSLKHHCLYDMVSTHRHTLLTRAPKYQNIKTACHSQALCMPLKTQTASNLKNKYVRWCYVSKSPQIASVVLITFQIFHLQAEKTLKRELKREKKQTNTTLLL